MQNLIKREFCINVSSKCLKVWKFKIKSNSCNNLMSCLNAKEGLHIKQNQNLQLKNESYKKGKRPLIYFNDEAIFGRI